MAIVVTKSSRSTNSVTRNVLFDAANAGDLLIAIIFGDGTGTYTWAGTNGATELTDTAMSTVAGLSIAYRIATGSESNITTTGIDATCSVSERSTHIGIRIPAGEWHGTTPPEIAVGASTSTNAPNPPSLNPSGWDVENTLWIAGYGSDSGAVTAYPAAFTDNRTASDTTSSAAYGAIATVVSAVASIDPATFSNSTTDDSVAFTIAVRPVTITNVDGSGGVTFAKPTLASSGAEAMSGSGGVAFAKPAFAGSGTEAMTGTGGVVFAKPSLAAVAIESMSGSGGVSFAKPSFSASGWMAPSGTGGVSFAKPSLAASGTGSLEATGSGGVAFAKPSFAGTAVEEMSGPALLTFTGPAFSASGWMEPSGTGGVAFDSPAFSISGAEGMTGTGSVTVGGPDFSVTGFEHPSGSGGVVFLLRDLIGGLGIGGEDPTWTAAQRINRTWISAGRSKP